MLDYNQQKKAFLELIEKLNNYTFESDFDVKFPQWKSETGVTGFPNKYKLNIKYKNDSNSNIELDIHLDQKGNWSSIEIVNIDINEKNQSKGLGRRLINLTINLAKTVGATKIYGIALETSNYSSVEFYEKCGFEIKEKSNIKEFYMNI